MKDFSIKKLYYSISEVSKITEVEQYVLRYWESEFEQLKPQKNRSGNRAYTNKDIQLILVIKVLLRDKKFTIEGAKKMLAEKGVEELAALEHQGESTDLKPVKEVPKSDAILAKKEFDKSDFIELKNILQEIAKFI
jgi:DNA-binding transcriptional MerR regulator